MPDEATERLPDEHFMLWILVAQTKDAILGARERDYARYGISNERRAVLYMIENHGGRATPVEIARDLFHELHSVTELGIPEWQVHFPAFDELPGVNQEKKG